MQLSATTAGLLGLLSLRPFTTYELAQQAQRSLRWFLPRAERHLYGEAKRLAKAGLATAEVGYTGRRRTTTYAITSAGRAALGEWLSQEPAPPSLECEHFCVRFSLTPACAGGPAPDVEGHSGSGQGFP